MRPSFLAILAAISIVDARPVDACTPEAEPDVSFRLHEAPAGGVWWIRGVDARFVGEEVRLLNEAGNAVFASIVSIGTQGASAIRVPDVAAGSRFTVPINVAFDDVSGAETELLVTAGTPSELDDVPEPPSIDIEQREVRVGYTTVFALTTECGAGDGFGFWNFDFDERPFLVVEDPGDDVVLDVQLQPLDEEPFTEVDSANETLFDARTSDAIDAFIHSPPETDAAGDDAFNVHARVRRIADGVASEVVTVEVPLDDIPEERRLHFNGCSCGSTPSTTVAPFAVALLALRAARRRR